jgi:hypothetical protein
MVAREDQGSWLRNKIHAKKSKAIPVTGREGL